MQRPVALWFDFTSTFEYPELRNHCARFFNIAYTTRIGRAIEDIKRLAPRLLFVDFDAPDQKRLTQLSELKRTHSRLPILMFTREHSEELAVWAFRARMWNYCVKPVPAAELEENLQALARIAGAPAPSRAAHLPATGVPEDLPGEPVLVSFARLQPALRFVEENFAERIQAEEVATLCGLTRFSFSRAFHAAIGMTFRDYVLRYRVHQACKLLKQAERSITEITFAVGFNDGSHFARIFRRYAGVLPSEYQEGADALAPLPMSTALTGT